MAEGVKGIILLGPPGAGKGTQANKISQSYGFNFISTGNILRESVEKGTELGKIAEAYVKAGTLVPDNIMIELIERTLNEISVGFVLDGFPRTLSQAEGLEKVFAKNEVIPVVIYIDVSDRVVIKRLSSRRVCPECNRIYNLISSPPLKDEKCDSCDTPLEQRVDDKEETIKKRLEVYRLETFPVVKFYREKGQLLSVNGECPPREIFKKIEESLNDSFKE